MYRPIGLRLLTLFFVGIATLSAENRREFTREFLVQSGVTVDFELARGEVEFVTGSDDKVTVRVVQTIATDDETKAVKAFDDWRFDFEQKGTTLGFHGRNRSLAVWDWDPVNQVQCYVTVTLPRSSNIFIKGQQLRADVDAIDGRLTTCMEGGRLYAKYIGGGVKVENLGGLVILSSYEGKADVDLQTGQIWIGNAKGPLKIDSNGGQVEVQQAWDKVDIRGETVDILLCLANAASGDATVQTAVGSIELKIEQTAAITIDAKAPWLGEIKTRGLDLDVSSGKVGSSRLKASLNGGGPLMKLRASGGTVSIIGIAPLGDVVAMNDR